MIDEEFTAHMEHILTNRSGIFNNLSNWCLIFLYRVTSLCDLAGETYVNDNIVSSILQLFTIHYHLVLFIPIWTLEGWQGVGEIEPNWQ